VYLFVRVIQNIYAHIMWQNSKFIKAICCTHYCQRGLQNLNQITANSPKPLFILNSQPTYYTWMYPHAIVEVVYYLWSVSYTEWPKKCIHTATLYWWVKSVYIFFGQLCVLVFFVIKPSRCTNSTNLFCHENLHISESLSVHHQEFIQCTLSNGMS
jgi:hypothetical protein